MQLQIGSTLQGGKYVINKTLGQGGFGITYEAEQVALQRRVAIKEFFMKEYCDRDSTTSHVTLGTSEGSKELVERFRTKFVREAQMIAGFDNPHIIRIHDVFEENGTAYYVMAFLDGGSLADKVKKDGPLPEKQALNYIKQVGEALDYIHKQNVLHLDVKPSNILLNAVGEAVLIDFGISKHYDSEGGQTSTTPAGISKGYAPMEQYQQGNIAKFSPATDVYSLGATLYFLLTGEVPPEAAEVYEDGLPEIKADVSATIKGAIEKAMAPKRKDRPHTIASFLDLLAFPDTSFALPGSAHNTTDKKKIHSSQEENTIIQTPNALPNAFLEQNDTLKTSQEPTIQEKGTSDKRTNTKTLLWILLAGIAVVGILIVLILVGKKNDALTPTIQDQDESNLEIMLDERSEIDIMQSSLRVSSTPSGASIWIDGQNTHRTTPYTFNSINPGTYSIRLTLNGYLDYSIKISLDAGQNGELSRTLTKKDSPLETPPQTQSQLGSNIQGDRIQNEDSVVENAASGGDLTYELLEVKPKFQGGDAMSTFPQWISEHLVYPKEAIDNGVMGRVMVEFTVRADGSVSNVKVLRGVDPSLDQEALRVVRSSPRWTPGEHDGKQIDFTFQVPVIFQLK